MDGFSLFGKSESVVSSSSDGKMKKKKKKLSTKEIEERKQIERQIEVLTSVTILESCFFLFSRMVFGLV